MLTKILLAKIRPPKVKLRDDVGDLEELKHSLRTKGLLEPILVRPIKEHYEIVFGHRRYLSALEEGWQEIECEIREVSDQEAFEIALAENLERKDMDATEQAKAFYAYTNTYGYGGITQLSERTHRSIQFISSRLSLLKLPTDTFNAVKSGKITTSHGEVLATLDADKAEALTKAITSEATGKPYLDVEGTRRAVEWMKRGADPLQAVETVINHPEWSAPKDHRAFDPIQMARESMVILLEKALVEIDSNIERLAEGEEKAKWTHEIRYPTHQLVDQAMKLKKEYGKK